MDHRGPNVPSVEVPTVTVPTNPRLIVGAAGNRYAERDEPLAPHAVAVGEAVLEFADAGTVGRFVASASVPVVEFHHYGYRAAVDISPGTDWVDVDFDCQAQLVKVLASDPCVTMAGDRGVKLLLELVDGRTFERSFPSHTHLNVYYPGRPVVADPDDHGPGCDGPYNCTCGAVQ